MRSQITEGLRRHDLDHMILPMISVDEFRSKIDDNTVIVVAFYCMEEDPAHDLSNFIERSPVNPLDTDVSPAPSKEGYYVTFVELKRGARFVENLLKILAEVSNLTDVSEWQFTSVNLPKGKVLPVTAENLKAHVDVKVKSHKPDERVDTDTLKEFLQQSSLMDCVLEQDVVTFVRPWQQHTYKCVCMTDQMPTQAIQLHEQAVSQAALLERLLDGPYTVYVTVHDVIVHHEQQDKYLILQSLS